MQLNPGEILKRGAYFLIPPPILADEQWKTHLALAVGVHLFAVVMALIAPFIFQYKPRLPEVYTVNLFSATDISTPQVTQPRKPTIVEPRKTKKKVPVQKEAAPAPVVKPAPPKAVSLKPIRTKTKKDLEKVADIKERLLAEQRAKKAQEAADKDIKNALDTLRDSLAAKNTEIEAGQKAGEETGEPSPAQSGSGVTVDEVTRKYLIAVNNQVQEHWVLPDLQNWKETLEAIYIIRVRRDGVVVESYFEKKSENTYFNQFVEKAIKDASPLPPFPREIKNTDMEIGLRFRPGELF